MAMSPANLAMEARRLASRCAALPLPLSGRTALWQSGERLARQGGQGEQFWQYRNYTQGDAAASVDWRRSAQGDTLYIREREREQPHRWWLWVDGSASMDFRSDEQTFEKVDHARLLLLGIASLVLEQGERVGVLPQSESRQGNQAVDALAVQLCVAGESDAVPAGESSGIWLVAGDFLGLAAEDYATPLPVAPDGGVLCHIADPLETHLPKHGRYRCVDPESDDSVLLNHSGESQTAYAELWDNHAAQVERLATAAGYRYLFCPTDAELTDTIWQVASLLQRGA